MLERLKKLKSKGYSRDFLVNSKGELECLNGDAVSSKGISIDDVYRIEDDSDPTHQAIIYAISCSSPKMKGTLVDSYGPNSDQQKDRFINKIN